MTSTTLSNGTIAANFEALQKKARKMTVEALRWSINDCREAIEANPEGPKAGFYADEIHTYAAELKRRKPCSCGRPLNVDDAADLRYGVCQFCRES